MSGRDNESRTVLKEFMCCWFYCENKALNKIVADDILFLYYFSKQTILAFHVNVKPYLLWKQNRTN